MITKKLDPKKKNSKVERFPFPASGFTAQMGVFKNKENADKFRIGTQEQLLSYLGGQMVNGEDPTAREGALFCLNCLIQGGGGESGTAQFSNVFIRKTDNEMWEVGYGLFLRKDDADKEASQIKKFYKGDIVIKKIPFTPAIIAQQT